MIINKTGEKYKFDGTEYIIGEQIIGTKESKYDGLFGVVTEIRDGKDKDTDNKTPDMYCTFEPPVLPSEILKIEKRFSELYGNPLTLADINFDDVIMAPKMIALISELKKSKHKVTVYEVSENWAYADNAGTSTELYAGFDDALVAFKNAISNDLSDGVGKQIQYDEDFALDITDRSYECYVKGYYSETHCIIQLEEKELLLSEHFIDAIKKIHKTDSRKRSFISQIEEWKEID